MVEMTRQQEAFAKADGFAAQQTNAAQALVGRTVRSALVTGDHPTEWDDRNQLILNLDDGTTVVVTGGYSSYTGASQDEYPMDVTIEIR